MSANSCRAREVILLGLARREVSVRVLFILGVWFAFPILAQEFAGYQFREGEPLAYKMNIGITVETSVEKQLVDSSNKFSDKKEFNIGVDCQLMPISQNENGTWKIRLVLDKTEQECRVDQDVKKISFDRKALTHLFNKSKTGSVDFNTKMDDLFDRQNKKSDSKNTQKAQPSQESSAEELFDVPILFFITSHGSLEKFEDRTELRKVLPDLNLKDCVELMFPTLPESDLHVGTTWQKDVPVELPEKPLGDYKVEPIILTLHYTVKTIEEVNGQRCARIGVSGFFKKEGLSIPIHQEEYKYLMWTTFVSRMEEEINGEYLFNFRKGIVNEVNINSTFILATYAGRKEDQYRNCTFTENTIHTRFVTKPASSSRLLTVNDGENLLSLNNPRSHLINNNARRCYEFLRLPRRATAALPAAVTRGSATPAIAKSSRNPWGDHSHFGRLLCRLGAYSPLSGMLAPRLLGFGQNGSWRRISLLMRWLLKQTQKRIKL